MELPEGAQDGMHVAVGAGIGRAKGILGGEEGFALQGPLNNVNEGFGEVGEIREGLVANVDSVTIGPAEEIGNIGFVFVAAGNFGYMHSPGFGSHVGENSDKAGPVKMRWAIYWLQIGK